MAADRLDSVNSDAGCFVCGPENRIGLHAKFECELSSGSSRAELQLMQDYQGWQGVVHGGIIASLLDEACIYACRTRADQCVTAELQVRYRKPVPTGAKVVVTGRLQESDRKIWQAVAQLKVDGTLYAEARAKIFVLD